MKKTIFLMMLCLGLLAGTAESKYHYRPYGNISFFYSSLSPYGEWINLDYGYAWRPNYVSHGWRPYLMGRWAWTDYGWYWVSAEPFGWATYHYGRWEYDDYYGWIWIPDDVWGPAWVEWRYNDDYIGWAPLPPQAVFSVSVGITFSDRWSAPIHYWNFVPCRNFTATRAVDYVQPVEYNRRIFGSTRGTVNIRTDGDRVVNRGVDVNFVERRGNIRVNRFDVVQRDRGNSERVVREANRDRIEMYRPRLENQNRGELAPPQVRPREQQQESGRAAERENRFEQRNNRFNNNGREDVTPPVSGRDTRPRDRDVREQQGSQQPRGSYRMPQQRDQMKEQQREQPKQQPRQLQEDRGRGRYERMQEQPRGRQQKEQSRGEQREQHGKERRPRP